MNTLKHFTNLSLTDRDGKDDYIKMIMKYNKDKKIFDIASDDYFKKIMNRLNSKYGFI